MSSAADHYDRLLSEHYTWMLGGEIETLAAVEAELLQGLRLRADPEDGAAAVDLGCGPGTQTLALARLGFGSVTAVDTSSALLDELMEHARHNEVTRIIHPVREDIRGALPRLTGPGSVAAVTCMGDTLPHLPSRTDVQELVTNVAEALLPGGSFVVSYRDLTHEIQGTDRFVLVRGTADQILTCYLEYVDEDTVQVHDLLHSRQHDAWQLKTSSYPKLRLDPRWLADQCRTAGLDIQHDETGPRGMRVLHAVKPQAV